jgi:hypothetical protein
MQPKPTFERGDIVLVLFPNSNLSSAKTRPALIVQADNLATIVLSAVHRVIGSLPMQNIDAALKHTLGS